MLLQFLCCAWHCYSHMMKVIHKKRSLFLIILNKGQICPSAMLLSDLQQGQKALIIRVFPSELREKLMEMGCVPGVEVSLLLKAPLGDPLAYDVDGYCLSMRRQEASNIEVELIWTQQKKRN
ncbi:MAG: ferrous iron transport protein A [Bacteroidia bacterium]|jgi:ferrous iron transport protein A